MVKRNVKIFRQLVQVQKHDLWFVTKGSLGIFLKFRHFYNFVALWELAIQKHRSTLNIAGYFIMLMQHWAQYCGNYCESDSTKIVLRESEFMRRNFDSFTYSYNNIFISRILYFQKKIYYVTITQNVWTKSKVQKSRSILNTELFRDIFSLYIFEKINRSFDRRLRFFPRFSPTRRSLINSGARRHVTWVTWSHRRISVRLRRQSER